jgi:hypothetical protein
MSGDAETTTTKTVYPPGPEDPGLTNIIRWEIGFDEGASWLGRSGYEVDERDLVSILEGAGIR